jgi:hypothetical protein
MGSPTCRDRSRYTCVRQGIGALRYSMPLPVTGRCFFLEGQSRASFNIGWTVDAFAGNSQGIARASAFCFGDPCDQLRPF